MEFIDSNEWVPVHTLSGYECCIEYYVSKHGFVKSTKGQIEKVLKPRINKNGYAQVNLTQRIGRRKTITANVHKLVALAFLESPVAMPGRGKGGSRILHVDGIKHNNSVSNLRWTKIKETVS